MYLQPLGQTCSQGVWSYSWIIAIVSLSVPFAKVITQHCSASTIAAIVVTHHQQLFIPVLQLLNQTLEHTSTLCTVPSIVPIFLCLLYFTQQHCMGLDSAKYYTLALMHSCLYSASNFLLYSWYYKFVTVLLSMLYGIRFSKFIHWG